MSMFTPVGVGGTRPGFRQRQRAAKRRRIVLAVVLVLAVAGAGGWWFLIRDPSPGRATAAATCPPVKPTPVTLLAPKQLTVNVYNATTRFGLARSVSEQLAKAGYKVDAVDNDPLKRSITGSAEVRHGSDGLRQAQSVLAVAPGAKLVPDNRKSTDVDLVLGEKWKKLAAEPVAPVVTPDPRPGCEPGKGNGNGRSVEGGARGSG